MESDTATLSQPAAAEAAPTAQPSAESDAGESGAAADRALSEGMNAFLRAGYDSAPTSKPESDEAAGESASDQEDVKPADPIRGSDGRFLPRRGAPQAVAAAESEVEQLKAQLAERDPAKIREQVLAELQAEREQQAESAKLDEMAKTREADVKRYRQLQEIPDHQLSGEDYQWREELKEKLASFPEVDAFRKAEAAEAVEANNALWRSEITASAAREGVDAEQWKAPGTTWDRMSRDLCDAREARVRASLQADLDELAERRREDQQTKYTGVNGLGSVRVPLGNGRSSSAVALNENEAMNRWLTGR